ncbi:uncharacterized protein [Drosophila virilis]|uniref:uncharacterized protein n=1 Tax=Drosophila virilis TaxID=7244 RepID=UPI0038B3D8CE
MKWAQLSLNHCEDAQALLTQSIRERNTDVAIICEPYKPIAGSVWWQVNVEKRPCGLSNHRSTRSEQQTTDSPCWKKYQKTLAIARDFNAWAVEWENKETNARRTTLLEEFAALDLGLASDGQKLTYCKAGRGPIIDLTLLSSSLYKLTIWKVSNEFTFSDHRAVHYEIHGRGRRKQQSKTTGPKWKDNSLDDET